MGVRVLDTGWLDVVNRLTGGYRAPVVVAAAFSRESTALRFEAITIRGGRILPSVDYDYGYLRILRFNISGGEAANILLQRVFAGVQGPLPDVHTDGSRAVWATQGTEYGLIAPTPTPRLIHYHGWSSPPLPIDEQRPLAAPGLPYYPTVRSAMLELMCGRTSIHSMASPVGRLEISLAYDRAYLGGVTYDDGTGLIVEIGSGSSEWTTSHELHVAWQLHSSDAELYRWSTSIERAGLVIAPMDAPPLTFFVALLEGNGEVIDQIDGAFRSQQANDTPLPSTAILDAFDFLDSAWRVFFRKRLIERPRLGGVADLSQPVTSRSDFSAHATHLDDLLRSLRIDDELLPAKEAEALPPTATLARMRGALRQVLSGPDIDGCESALNVLAATNALRVAFQHKVDPRKSSDLPSALARLGIDYPPDWSLAWDVVGRHVVSAVGEIRRALQVNGR